MKLTAVGILKWNGEGHTPVFLGVAADVSSFGYFQRGAVREGLMFLSRTIVQRTQPGQRQSVKSEEYFCHVHVKDTGLAAIVVADQEYPTTAAFAIITRVLDEFAQQAGDSWKTADADGTVANLVLEAALTKFQVRFAPISFSMFGRFSFNILGRWRPFECPIERMGERSSLGTICNIRQPT